MSETRRAKIGRLIRSAGVGVVASVVDLLALVVLVELIGATPVYANIPALACGLAIQFFGNKYFAFRDKSRAFLRQGLQFALIELGALALNGLAFHILASHTLLPYVLLRLLCSAGVYAAYSFPLWGLIFRARPSSSGPRNLRPALSEGE